MPENSAFLKLERAKHYLGELQRLLKSFYELPPCEIHSRINPDNENRREYYIGNAKKPPVEILLITGDILQNLRSALDHLAYGLCSESREDIHNIYFPIAGSERAYEKKKEKWTEGMSTTAKRKIDELKPYQGGNDILWRLHKLNNIDKHRLLITVECCFPSVDFGSYARQTARQTRRQNISPEISRAIEAIPSVYFNLREPLRLQNDEIVFIDVPNAEEKVITFWFEIQINEPGVISGEPLPATIEGMIKTIAEVLKSFAPLLDSP